MTFTPSQIFSLAVDFLSDFFTAFLTAMGVGTAGSTMAAQQLTIPAGWILFLAICGSLVSALRGLKKNISPPVVETEMVRAARRAA